MKSNGSTLLNYPRRLFMFFGTDVEEYGRGVLKESYLDGYSLLPLDGSAIGFADEAKLPFMLIDRYLRLDALLGSRKQAVQFEQSWFKPAQDEFTLYGICWPYLDRYAMWKFWLDAALTTELIRHFLGMGGREVRFFQSSKLRPALFYYRSDIQAAILSQLLPDKIRPIVIDVDERSSTERDPFVMYGMNSITFDTRAYTGTMFTPAVLEGKVVLALNPGELHRFAPVIRQLSNSFPGNVAVVVIYPQQDQVEGLSEKYGIPVVTCFQSKPLHPNCRDRFIAAYDKLINATYHKPLETITKNLKYHFQYYCDHRWPSLVDSFRAWQQLWCQYRPKAVIVSSLNDCESQLPAEAANRCSIPTFSIPHGTGYTKQFVSISQHIIYSYYPQRIFFEREGISSDRLKRSRELTAVNEYPVVARESFPERKSWRILVLVDPVFREGWIAPTIEPSAQVAALEILDNPPSDISENISLMIKVHPWKPELALISSVSGSLANKVLPPDCELQTVAEQADLILAVNYAGTAVTHVLRLGKPVIFLWTERLLSMAEKFDMRYAVEFMSPAGVWVHTAEQLWETVRAFFTNPEVACQMRAKCRQFYRKNLDVSNCPTVGEIIQDALCKTEDSVVRHQVVSSFSTGEELWLERDVASKAFEVLPQEDDKDEKQQPDMPAPTKRIECSVIIPTYNRCASLERTIESLVNQDYPPNGYEVLILDNGSTDGTQQVAAFAIKNHKEHNIRYIYEPEPGMSAGRHRGAFEAKGEILVFVDDDIEAVPSWLAAIVEAFEDESVHLVGGPSIGKFEVEPPDWVDRYFLDEKERFVCGALSLSCFKTDKKIEIEPTCIWGLNYSIRKGMFFEAGGFHPDCIPRRLQHFQGDGEVGLSQKVKEKGLKAIYVPGAKVYHIIPRERLTVSHFEERYYYQGVCDSFTEIRKNGGLANAKVPYYDKAVGQNRVGLSHDERRKQTIYQQIYEAYLDGFRFHQEAVRKSRTLLDWVLRDNYLDYKLPRLEDDVTVKSGS